MIEKRFYNWINYCRELYVVDMEQGEKKKLYLEKLLAMYYI